MRDQGFDALERFAIYSTARKIHAMLQEEGVTPGLFGMCEFDRLHDCIRAAKQKEAFTAGDKRENRLWTKAAHCYLQFAETEKFDGKTAWAKRVSPEPVSTPTAAEKVADHVQSNDGKLAPAQVPESPKGDSALDPSLLALLPGEELSALRNALIQKGICTLEEFKRHNLWVFMNQNGLYSIGERQAVYSSVRRSMAGKYPLGFRGLIGQCMPRSEAVPL